ncbi:MAG TPA: hypothetical protein VK171_05095, partial [Fimbriimonas sp.]|nr:hypothetical protein [Fimbriimonas sp.]
DHYFAGRAFDGTSLCKCLAPVGIRVIGMSSVDHANHSMMRAGATIAMRKDLIMNWLRAN